MVSDSTERCHPHPKVLILTWTQTENTQDLHGLKANKNPALRRKAYTKSHHWTWSYFVAISPGKGKLFFCHVYPWVYQLHSAAGTMIRNRLSVVFFGIPFVVFCLSFLFACFYFHCFFFCLIVSCFDFISSFLLFFSLFLMNEGAREEHKVRWAGWKGLGGVERIWSKCVVWMF